MKVIHIGLDLWDTRQFIIKKVVDHLHHFASSGLCFSAEFFIIVLILDGISEFQYILNNFRLKGILHHTDHF